MFKYVVEHMCAYVCMRECVGCRVVPAFEGALSIRIIEVIFAAIRSHRIGWFCSVKGIHSKLFLSCN